MKLDLRDEVAPLVALQSPSMETPRLARPHALSPLAVPVYPLTMGNRYVSRSLSVASLCALLVACGASQGGDGDDGASTGGSAATGGTAASGGNTPAAGASSSGGAAPTGGASASGGTSGGAPTDCGIEPADPELIPEARNILCYLDSVYGQRTLSAIYSTESQTDVTDCAGITPAIYGDDLSGWNPPKYGESYNSVMTAELNNLAAHYARGGIPQLQWHWPNPLTGGSDFADTQIALTEAQWDDIVTPGTADYDTMIADLDYHADYIKRILTAQNIPVLWRPLHEIDGGWFWWTCASDPTKTAQLWRIVFDRLVNYHQLHNLIWVYSAGIETPGGDTADTPFRTSAYPGSDFVDIAGIDLYAWNLQTGMHEFWDWNASYRDMFDMMAAVAPGKMIALTECQGMPDSAKAYAGDAAFAPWLWAMPWWGIQDDNTCEWIDTTYNDPNVINLDDLPSFR